MTTINVLDIWRSIIGTQLEALRTILEIGLDSGTATGGSSTTLEDTSKDWGVDQWKNAYIEITEGTGAGQIRKIASNTSNTITVEAEWTTPPDSTSKYRIFGAPTEVNLLQSILGQFDIPLSSTTRVRVYEQTFESGDTDTSVSGATQTVQSSVVYGGTYALQVTIPAGSTGYVETPTRPVSPNQQVTFSFAHREDANITDVKLIVVWLRPNLVEISTEEYTLTPSTSWQIDSRTVTAPSNAAYMALRMQATASASGDGNVYLDDMFIDLVGQIFRVDSEGQIKVVDESLQPTRSSPVQELSSQTIAASDKAEFTISDTNGYSAIILSVRATYSAAASSGVRVRWLYSPDGTNYDTENGTENESQYQDIAFTAGDTEQETVVIPIFQPYVKVQIVNLDTAESVTVSVWRTLIR